MEFNPILKVWKLHPDACRIEKSDIHLNGHANKDAIKFCGPYKYANQIGYWIYSPVDIDIMWKGGRDFEHILHTPYDNSDYKIVKNLIKDEDPITNNDIWISPQEGRTKFTFGMVEEGLVQFWTGCILKTPPNWCLQVRSVINFPERGFQVMNGVLDTDWMFYDIWLNIVFTAKNEWIKIRKNDKIPLAQLVPIPRETYTLDWTVESKNVNREDEESNSVFSYWLKYNQKKFNCGGKQFLSTDGNYRKNSGTFFSERQMALCPHMKNNSKKVCYMINNSETHFEMLSYSVRSLRKYNQKIPIEILFLSDVLPENWKFFEKEFDVKFVVRQNKEENYFFYNREYLAELECESLLYLDSDTIINFDVLLLFEKYHHDFVACENFWVYSYGWDKSFLTKIKSPYNGGVILTNRSRHKEIYKNYIPLIREIEKADTPFSKWCMNTQGGYNREEMAISLYIDQSDLANGYFETKDAYNIRTMEDLDKIQDHGIFHTYGYHWQNAMRRLKSKIKNKFLSTKSFIK